MTVRWMGIGLAAPILIIAASQLSCLADDRSGSSAGEAESALTAPGPAVDVPIQFEVDHPAPAGGPVLTR